MGIVTWTKAHVLHNTDSMAKLAMKGAYDINKVESHVANKLEKIRNCDTHYKAEKLNHYLNILVKLDAKRTEMAEGSQLANPSHSTVGEAIPIPAFNNDAAIAQNMLDFLNSPDTIRSNIDTLKKHITTILTCETYQDVLGQGKVRNVVTLLDSLSRFQTNKENAMQCASFLQDTVADKIFKDYGDKRGELANEQEWGAVKEHLTKIQQWAADIAP
ncbi:hypothetical protein JGC56_21395 [Salmonella enterica subsp. enterica serovar Saintpaul]|nr:hypothetical protein [Salmonella enterica subsp. enterica serovar Saintpaul]